MVKHSHESIGQWCASLKIRQQEKSTTIKERNAFTLKLLLCLKLHSSKRCSSYLDTDHQTNTNAKRRRFFPPWCLRCCCSSRCWAKCQIRRRGTRPGGAQGSARARPSQAPREILVSSSSSGLGPDFLYIGPRRQDAVLYVSATTVRWTAPRGACNRQAFHVWSGLHREHRPEELIRYVRVSHPAAAAALLGDPHPRGRKLKHRARS